MADDPIGVVWLVGMTNAFNLLDNMDGLAATSRGISFAFFAIVAGDTVRPSSARACRSPWRSPSPGSCPSICGRDGKALACMGDSGSQLIGFTLAALGLASSWKVAGTTVATLVLPVLVLAVPILDTTLVTIVRLLEGRPIYQGGRDHSSHRLVSLGVSEKGAVVLLALSPRRSERRAWPTRRSTTGRSRRSAYSSRSSCSCSSEASSPMSTADAPRGVIDGTCTCVASPRWSSTAR